MDTLSAPATLLGRVMLAAIFIQSGYGKIGGYAGTIWRSSAFRGSSCRS
jgi:uncharacterized membrane protein YphA (DoxX/SURF4 family)